MVRAVSDEQIAATPKELEHKPTEATQAIPLAVECGVLSFSVQ